VLRPVVSDAIMGLAEDNPGALQLPFVKGIVAESLGDALTTPASSDATQVEFLVEPGDTAKSIASRLEKDGLIADSRAFVFIAIDRELTGALQQGTFVLRRNETPDQLVSALLAPPTVKYGDSALRRSLRLEQFAATLQTLGSESGVERRIAVLGPMRELGEHSAGLHAGLAPAILDAKIDRLILIGEEMRPLAEALVGKTALDLVTSVDEAITSLQQMLQAGDAVLVKASNSVGLARLVEQVAGRA
jgi:hypothetical protein